MEKKRVIVVGAGIAGLTLARELSPDFDITILEARDRAGGRIHTVTIEGAVVERGAEFIHGQLPETLKLAREAGSVVIPVSGKMYRSENGILVEDSQADPRWDELLSRMGEQQHDLTLADFLEEQFSGSTYTELRKQAIAFAGGFDLADPGQASVKVLYREWSEDQEQNFRLRDGYGSLVRFLEKELAAKGVRLLLNQPVSTIELIDNLINVTTIKEDLHVAEAVVVTVPVGVIRAGGIRFNAPLQPQVILVNDIGMGEVIRFVFGFRKPLWPSDTGFLFSDEAVPTWWTSLQDGVHQLAGWAGGARAAALAGNSEAQLLDYAIHSLSVILGLSVGEIKEELLFRVVTDWSASEWSRGGYSYATPQTEKSRGGLNQPGNRFCWFAGEGYTTGAHPGTVESAIVHAQDVADSIRLSFNA